MVVSTLVMFVIERKKHSEKYAHTVAPLMKIGESVKVL